MRTVVAIAAVLALFFTASCGDKVHQYDGPEVTRIVVNKGDRKMYLLHGTEVLKSYDVDLGFAPEGHKQFEGDGKTPEGRYVIDRRNPNSAFYLSIGISYPNREDVEYAKAQGKKPGGEIFIHGGPRPKDPDGPDWTAGCISVTDREMIEIYTMVRLGTVIDVNP
ncbi:L,D-transpeptidase catalytic domain [Aliiroseovarius halocynthiae]|uniref:L,D-transpeptidase family protein n=1 Tax=Aliiroseovarius halocynthiae TaxID=985055 RepID=A0A545SNN4_9RHOB|nr:L,D-transpeptidase family protein [Aliiroseovarius halocynthiae]TQV66571.1 L,D-transpeptidase family protein [Aliiroseovarius halocynthiae]SMR82561.1 L,D-transpeptidase catalytic domain [Aliiroseovarius halocynthiae]